VAVLPLPGDDLLIAAYSASLGGGQDAVVMRVAPPGPRAPAPGFLRRRID
jgi:hypothetical protein